MHPTNVAFASALGLLVFGIATKPSSHRWLYFPPILALGIFLYRNRLNEADTVPIGLLLSIASDYILLTDVQREIFKTRGLKAGAAKGSGSAKSKERPEVQISEKGLGERVGWSACLLYSVRGIGWSHGRWAASCPSIHTGSATRRDFILSRLKWLLLNIGFWLIAMAGIAKNPSFHKDSTHFSNQPLLWKSWSMFLFIGASTPLLSIGLNLIPGLVAVSLGISEPQDWPYLFGSAGSAYTIRNFWGKTWHQLLRRPLTSHGKFIARSAGVKEGSDYAYYVQVLFAFLLSGLIHTSSLSDTRPLQFFLLQASGIIIEDIALDTFKKGTSAKSWLSESNWQWIGYVWVWTWFVHTLWPFWNAMADSEVFGRGFNVLDLISWALAS